MNQNNRFCNKCGAQLPDGASFCTSCGNATDEQPGAMGRAGRPLLLYLGGGALALALLGGLAYAIHGAANSGPGEADTNGDGTISLEEFRVELMELKRPQPGRWKITMQGSAAGGAADESFVRFSGEMNECDERFWSEFNQAFDEIRNPGTFSQLEREYRRFTEQQDGKITIERFTINGDAVELKVSGGGSDANGRETVKGNGDFAVKGIVSENRVQLEGPVNFAFNASGWNNGSKLNLEMGLAGLHKLDAERVSACP